jgi:hypothetical protein
LCFWGGGEGKYETGSFEKKNWRRNAAMNFENRPDIRHGYVPVYDNRPHGSLNHPWGVLCNFLVAWYVHST